MAVFRHVCYADFPLTAAIGQHIILINLIVSTDQINIGN